MKRNSNGRKIRPILIHKSLKKTAKCRKTHPENRQFAEKSLEKVVNLHENSLVKVLHLCKNSPEKVSETLKTPLKKSGESAKIYLGTQT